MITIIRSEETERVRTRPRIGLRSGTVSIRALAVLLSALLGIEIYMFLLLRKYNAGFRMVPVSNLEAIDLPASRLDRFDLPPEFRGKDHLVLLRRLMDAVPKAEAYHSRDIGALFRHVTAGGGTGCSGMADLYLAILQANGIKSRRVAIMRDLYGIWDSHVTVEVFLDGKWVIADPTFHVNFVKDGKLLGAQDIKDFIYQGEIHLVQEVFLGEVAYPPRLESYYINWKSLFSNVFVMDFPVESRFASLPPFRYWLGPRYFYQEGFGNKAIHIHFHQDLYMAIVVILPIAILGLGTALLVLWAARVGSSPKG